MTLYSKLITFIKKFEGGFANDPVDLGGATNSGITLATFQHYYGIDKDADDLRRMTETQWKHIFLDGFWEKCKCDSIVDLSVAYMLCDFAWHSGVKNAVKSVQGVVGVTQDGIMGPQTLKAINAQNGEKLFYRFFKARQDFLYNLIKRRPSYKKYELGFMRRLFELYSLCYD